MYRSAFWRKYEAKISAVLLLIIHVDISALCKHIYSCLIYLFRLFSYLTSRLHVKIVLCTETFLTNTAVNTAVLSKTLSDSLTIRSSFGEIYAFAEWNQFRLWLSKCPPWRSGPVTSESDFPSAPNRCSVLPKHSTQNGGGFSSKT